MGTMAEDPVDRKSPLTEDEVRAVLDAFLRLEVRIIPTRHFIQTAPTRDFGTQDASYILSMGSLTYEPQFNELVDDWTYGIEGEDFEGERLTIRFGISADRLLIWLVTAY